MEVIADNLRQADEDNPNGYYEFERVKSLKEDRTWLYHAQGKVVKMVSMLLYELPSDLGYKIVFMRRDLDEICASQRVMLGRKGEEPGSGGEEMSKLYSSHLLEIESWLAKQQNMEVLYMNYNEIMENSAVSVEEINAFFDNKLSVDRMKSVVDKSLYRQRRVHAPAAPCCGPVQQENRDRDQEREVIEAHLKSLGYM